eukprot:TRINITY_DN8207_c0_g1_i1.p2 TRINITY_DN8207_c0_g1~~TRINITY_DN8207_c0_g1_i1.p2  ORF type:complete len:67 (-),score=3.38 TRINITY_DN8207_c0_g1_i1:100-300(-)
MVQIWRDEGGENFTLLKILVAKNPVAVKSNSRTKSLMFVSLIFSEKIYILFFVLRYRVGAFFDESW